MIEPNLKVLNKDIMLDLIGDDPVMIRQFEIDFLKQAKESLQKIILMYNNDSFKAVKEEAHYLKTSAAAVGAEQTSHLLKALETSGEVGDKQQCKHLILEIKSSLKQVHGAIIDDSSTNSSMPPSQSDNAL
ncbi:Hpt domain-containing protein [Shewanella woodyi]|uniref:Hpt domain-containing protein n=1 Tax=Shewanella woodyi TaxID=60961 RepID=UPI0037488B3D